MFRTAVTGLVVMAEWSNGEDGGMGDGMGEWSNDKDGGMADGMAE